jgi:hypothetical protein
MKFFTALYDVELLTDDAQFIMPNAERIRETIDDLGFLFKFSAVPGPKNPLYTATERAMLPDGYTNNGETRALHEDNPFLLLKILDAAIKASEDKDASLERTFANKLVKSEPLGRPATKKKEKEEPNGKVKSEAEPPKRKKRNRKPASSGPSTPKSAVKAAVSGFSSPVNGSASGATMIHSIPSKATPKANADRSSSSSGGAATTKGEKSRLMMKRGQWVRVRL